MATETATPRLCFLAVPDHSEQGRVARTIRKAIADARFRIAKVAERPPKGAVGGAVAEAIARADCIVADVTGSAPAVFFELGLAQALDKA